MMCYKDKTFCQFYEECKDGEKCPHSYNEITKNQAIKQTLFICFYRNKPDCFKNKCDHEIVQKFGVFECQICGKE